MSLASLHVADCDLGAAARVEVAVGVFGGVHVDVREGDDVHAGSPAIAAGPGTGGGTGGVVGHVAAVGGCEEGEEGKSQSGGMHLCG